MCESLSSKHVMDGSTPIGTLASFTLFAPCESVTLRLARNSPAFWYVWASVGEDCVTSGEPSPKVNVYDVIESPGSGSEEPEPSNVTWSGTLPELVDDVRAAVG